MAEAGEALRQRLQPSAAHVPTGAVREQDGDAIARSGSRIDD
jgi:hypothetical protein